MIEAALDLIDTDGLAALNLRKLAGRLGVSAMTPYSYFTDKAELLQAMVEYALEPVRLAPSPDTAWDDRIAGALRGMHAALDRHPGAVELIMAESETTPLEEFRRDLLEVLGHTGLGPTESADALRSLTSYVLGYTVLTRMRPRDARRHPPDSFEHGLAMMMDSLRRTVPG